MQFKESSGGTYSIDNFSKNGLSKANSKTEGKINGWNKLNEEAVTEGTIGSINDINASIDTLIEKMKSQKSKFESLISADGVISGTSCVGDHSCDVSGKLSSYASTEIASIKGEIDLLNSSIESLGLLKTYFGFIKPDNMYYK